MNTKISRITVWRFRCSCFRKLPELNRRVRTCFQKKKKKKTHYTSQAMSESVQHYCQLACAWCLKGEVRALCRYSVFDGNGLLGHRLIDSRWFEKNPPTESGWKRRSKKNAHVPVFRAEMPVTQYVLSSSRHLVTPLIYIHFCVWLGLFVDRWWLKEVWYAPDFLLNCSTRVPLAAPGITRSPSERICRGTLSQKTRNWPTCKPVNVHERSRERRRNFDPAFSVDNLTQ